MCICVCVWRQLFVPWIQDFVAVAVWWRQRWWSVICFREMERDERESYTYIYIYIFECERRHIQERNSLCPPCKPIYVYITYIYMLCAREWELLHPKLYKGWINNLFLFRNYMAIYERGWYAYCGAFSNFFQFRKLSHFLFIYIYMYMYTCFVFIYIWGCTTLTKNT